MSSNREMSMDTMTVAEAKKHFSELLGEVAYRGKQYLITKRGRPMARIVPVGVSEKHLGDVEGWLDETDPFFKIVETVVAERKRHVPRILKKNMDR